MKDTSDFEKKDKIEIKKVEVNNENLKNKSLELELQPEIEGCIYNCVNGSVFRNGMYFPCPICSTNLH